MNVSNHEIMTTIMMPFPSSWSRKNKCGSDVQKKSNDEVNELNGMLTDRLKKAMRLAKHKGSLLCLTILPHSKNMVLPSISVPSMMHWPSGMAGLHLGIQHHASVVRNSLSVMLFLVPK